MLERGDSIACTERREGRRGNGEKDATRCERELDICLCEAPSMKESIDKPWNQGESICIAEEPKKFVIFITLALEIGLHRASLPSLLFSFP